MRTHNHKSTEEVAREILEYVRVHPRAMDTPEGVTQWWLLHENYVRSVETVEKALQLLTERGLLQRIVNQDGTPIYRAAPEGKREDDRENNDP